METKLQKNKNKYVTSLPDLFHSSKKMLEGGSPTLTHSTIHFYTQHIL